MKRLRIWWAKRQFKAAYLSYMSALDQMDCGAALAAEVSPRIARTKVKANQRLARLARIDPDNCPCSRIA